MNHLRPFCTAILVALAATGCSVSTEQLTRDVRASMEAKFTPKGIKVRSLVITKKGGNEYSGVLETQEPNGTFTYAVDIVSDGKNITWQTRPAGS